MKKFVYVDGIFVPKERALISVFDYGLLYGFGVFESMRAYNGRVFKFEEHLKRMKNSAKKVGIKFDDKKMQGAVIKLLAKNNLKNAYVRATLTYGIGKSRLILDGKQKPALIVFAEELPKDLRKKQFDGVKVGFSKIRQYSKSSLNSIKSTNYLQTALRKNEAKERRLGDIIILNEKNDVVEASTSNIFMVDKNSTLTTPRIQDGCLPGITRKTIIKMAKKLKTMTIERRVKPRELLKAKEVFMTNSIMEIVPIIQIGKTKIKKGDLTKKLQEEYNRTTKTL